MEIRVYMFSFSFYEIGEISLTLGLKGNIR